MNDTVQLLPPPGPLSWLFPELAKVGDPAAVTNDDVIDLGRTPRFGPRLVDLVRGRREIRITAGPLGETLRRLLAEKLRDEDVSIRMVDRPVSMEQRLLSARGPTGELHLLPIAPANAREDLSRLIESTRTDPDCFGKRFPVPYFLTRVPPAGPEAGDDDAATQLAASFFGLLPGDHYPDEVRSLTHELLQALHPDRFLRFLALENQALAGFDPYDEILRGRFEHTTTARRPAGKALVIVVDGIDGSGKSTQLGLLREHLEQQGLRVAQHKLFRHGVFHDTVTDMTRHCAGGRNLHLWPLQRAVKVFDSLKVFFTRVEPDLASFDVVLFDRYVPTHLAAGLGRYHVDPYCTEWLRVLPAADLTFLMDLPHETALERVGRRPERTVDENPYMLSRYRDALLELSRREKHVVLDALRPRDENQATIRRAVDRLVAGRDR